jgi:disulfide bond formation protein DsbB
MARFMDLAACPLASGSACCICCLPFALGGLIGARRRRVRRTAALLMALAAGAGVFVAGYQVWIQRFAPLTTCGGREPWWEAFVRWAGELAPLLFKASGLCSDPA